MYFYLCSVMQYWIVPWYVPCGDWYPFVFVPLFVFVFGLCSSCDNKAVFQFERYSRPKPNNGQKTRGIGFATSWNSVRVNIHTRNLWYLLVNTYHNKKNAT